MRVVI